MFHSLTGPESRNDFIFLADAIGRDDQRNMASDGLLGRIPKQALCAGVPAFYDALE
jgi:hypothetical protein